MANNTMISFPSPAAEWTDGFPLGNGRLGCMVFGGTERERIQFNEDTLWSGHPIEAESDSLANENAATLARVRELVGQKKYSEAQALCDEKMLGDWSAFYLPCGDIFLDFDTDSENITDYTRTLDLQNAVAITKYSSARFGKITRTVFASHPRDAIFINIVSSKKSALNFRMELQSPLQNEFFLQDISSTEAEIVLQGRAPDSGEMLPPYKPPVLYDEERGIKFCAIAKAILQGGSIRAKKNSLEICGADFVTIIICAATNFVDYKTEPNDSKIDCFQKARTMMEKATANSFTEILCEHKRDFSSIFNRVEFSLQEKIPSRFSPAKYFNFGRYLLISCSREKTQAANLQGIWNQDLRPAWNSNYTTNINLQMNYWPSETCALGDFQEPLFSLLRDLAEIGKNTARVRYGADGWCCAHNTDLWRKTTPADGSSEWALWPMAGAWLSTHIWEHFVFSLDAEFLRDNFFVIQGAAQFMLDWLFDDGGILATCPSISPENNFLDSSGKKCCVTKSSEMDLSLARELFTCYEELFFAAKKLKVALDEKSEIVLQKIRAALPKIPAPKIGSEGRLLEWRGEFAEAEPGHRHLSHLFSLYPGHGFSRIKDNAEREIFFAAAKTSLDYRLSHGGGHTGWSCAWVVSLYARLGLGEKCAEYLNTLFEKLTLPNLLDVCPPFQIDGNFGGTAAIAEMLIQSECNISPDGKMFTKILLLPALPKNWTRGKISGIRVRGGFSVSLEWSDGKLSRWNIQQNANSPIDVQVEIYYNKKRIK